ncbi:MAG: hypothetical protein ACI4VU_00395 [Methanobrevibacter sp.]
MTPYYLSFLNSVMIVFALIFALIIVFLLGSLTKFYKESYDEIKSKFTTGLLYFSSLLLIGNIIVLIALIAALIFGIEIDELGGTLAYSALLVINMFQLVAYSILYKITMN